MADSVVFTEIAKAIPVLVGGILAVAGGVGSQFLVHRLTDRREQTKFRQERVEALVKAIYAHGQWIDEKQTKMVFRNEDHDPPNPLDEARMIQSLHFPELKDELLAIQQAYIPLLQFINEQRIKHMKSKESFIAEWNSAPFNDAYKRYLAAVNTLVQRARTLLEAR
jgi:hypothetical protein